MRLLSFIFIVVTSFASVSAQRDLARQSFNTGTIAARDSQFETALESYQKALFYTENVGNNDETLSQIHSNIGVCLYQLQRPNEAVQELAKSIRLSNGKYQRAFYALGMVQTDLKNWREAISAFREAVKIKQDDGEAWFDLAMVYLQEKDFSSAENAFQNSIKYKSVATADAHNNLGVISAIKGDFEAAENEFKTALQTSNGKSIEAKSNLKFCENKQNSGRELIAQLEFSRKIN